jgi:zinc D-Ala-D-Ala carboxypeptidase
MPTQQQPGAQAGQSAPSPALDSWEGLGIPLDYGSRRNLPLQVEATRLITIARNADGMDIQLSPKAALAWLRLKDSAARSGVTLVAISGFRSVERQSEIIRAKLLSGQAIEEILQTVAAPGCSEHHTGRALDIGIPGEEALTEGFADTPAFYWLEVNAGSFGFRLSYPRDNPHGISYEPWHWCFHEKM